MHEPKTAGRSDELTDLLRGLRLGVIAFISAVATAALVIAWGGGQRHEPVNTHYGDLVLVSGG